MATSTTTRPEASSDPRAVRSRKAIIAATVELLSCPNTHSGQLTVTQVAERAGVSRRAIYLNFETLENVILQSAVDLLDAEFADRPLMIDGGRNRAAPPEVCTRLARHLAQHAAFYRAALTGPSAHLVITHIRDACHESNLAMLRAAAPDTDDDMADFVFHGIMGLCTAALVAGDVDTERLARRLWATLRRCLPGPTALRLNSPSTDAC